VSWLITGGAGYIGAHVVELLLGEGLNVVVLDDLSTGDRGRLPDDVPLVVASVADASVLADVLRRHDVQGVVHFAAKKRVAESVADPLLYYRENVGGFESLLQAMTDVGVSRLVLSSSAAVYGTTDEPMVTEESRLDPANPYGFTKLVCERMLREVGVASGLSWVALRYFNVAGAGRPGLADTGAANLIPMVFEAISAGRDPQVFGVDYPTRDGSCVRDFVHVSDLAVAHVVAARALLDRPMAGIYNVGTGHGSSVKEVIATVAAVTGAELTPKVVGRRPGDPAQVVADPRKIEHELGWRASLGLREMVDSAWVGWQSR
jgi:UDP-glucose 4-epimerase